MIDMFRHHLLRLAIVEGAARLAHLLLVPAGGYLLLALLALGFRRE
jgi:hypothetical protein